MDTKAVSLSLLILQLFSKVNLKKDCLLECKDVQSCERSCPEDLLLYISSTVINASSCENSSLTGKEMTTITHSSSQGIFVKDSTTSTTSVPPVALTDFINNLHVYFGCVNTCPSGYYMNLINKTCLLCGEVCQNCNNFNESVLRLCACNITESVCLTYKSVPYGTIIFSASSLFIFLILIILRSCTIKCEQKRTIEDISRSRRSLAKNDIYYASSSCLKLEENSIECNYESSYQSNINISQDFDVLHTSKKHLCLIEDQNVRSKEIAVDISKQILNIGNQPSRADEFPEFYSMAGTSDSDISELSFIIETSSEKNIYREDNDKTQSFFHNWQSTKVNMSEVDFGDVYIHSNTNPKPMIGTENGQQRPSKENKHLQAAELPYCIDDDSHRLSSSPKSANLENDNYAKNVGSDKSGLCENKENSCSFDNNIPGVNYDNGQSCFHNLQTSLSSEFDFKRDYKRIDTDPKTISVSEMNQKSCINDNEHVPADVSQVSNNKDSSLKSSGTEATAIIQSEYVSSRKNSRDIATVDLICDGTYLHCFVDKRLTNNYKDNSQRTVNTVTITELFYKLDRISNEWKIKSEYLIIISLMNGQHDEYLFEEILFKAVVNKLSFVCRWILNHFQYEDECIVKVLSKSFEVGNNEIIKTLAWKVTRQFYMRHKQILEDKATDIYPAYKCECHNACTKQVCLLTGKKVIAIEWKGKDRFGLPDAFFCFEVKLFNFDDVCKTGNTATGEMKEILSKITDNIGSSTCSLYMPEIDGKIASTMFEDHKNLSMICPSLLKSTNYGFSQKVSKTSCIQLFCKRKGYIPLGEKHFPSIIGGHPTDVLQGHSHFAANPLRIGDKICTDTKCGTLGGFYRIAGTFECFLTCAHVLYSLSTLLKPKDDPKYDQKVEVFLDSSKRHCGNAFRVVFNHDDPNKTSVDAGLVMIKQSDFSIDTNDIVRDMHGASHPASSLNLTSEFVNIHSSDYTKLCCTGQTVQFVAIGAIAKRVGSVTLERLTDTNVSFEENVPVNNTANGSTFHPLMTQPAHMRLQVGPLTEKRVFTMYNQMVMNIPLELGDSGTCIYINGNTNEQSGCLGMAIAFCSNSGLSLVTPMQEIIRAIN